ncbi:MAG: hypothetical protein HQ481_00010 [Alphaproteobacteria bacterium]|nr:hypothetical protein [Alphaproteobacteria bacterium]
MKLLRTIRFDDSDTRVFETGAEDGEWAVPGGFEFADDTAETLTGKRRQAFANGFLGLGGFGRATFVVVASIDTNQRDAAVKALAAHFVERYGAPTMELARPAAETEVGFAAELAGDFEVGTVLAISRELTDGGVKESYRRVASEEPGAAQSLWSMFGEDGKPA